jgi:hypothetical protein
MSSEMKKRLRPLDMSVLEEEQANLQTCRVCNKVFRHLKRKEIVLEPVTKSRGKLRLILGNDFDACL